MNNWWDDTFEKLERGQSNQPKLSQHKPAQQQKIENIQSDGLEHIRERLAGGQKNYTDIDTAQLENTYKEQDNPEMKKVREKLHYLRLQQGETIKAIEERKREEEERKRQIEEEEQKKLAQSGGLATIEAPQGKERKSILGGKRKKAKVNLENKPGGGKQ